MSRPSDALAAKRIAEATFSGLFLGLAGVTFGVLERRGLRRGRDWPATIPPLAASGGVGSALVVGVFAGCTRPFAPRVRLHRRPLAAP